MFTRSVGVAPGTTTLQLGRIWDPYTDPIQLIGMRGVPKAMIRWDIIGVVGGGALILAMGIGLVANALSK